MLDEFKFYSNNYYTKKETNERKIEKISTHIFDADFQNAERIAILSAYYSRVFFEDLFLKVKEENRASCRIILILNGLQGKRQKDQISELKVLVSNLKEMGFKEVEIYINMKSPLFHTKLYYVDSLEETEEKSYWFMGSANASFNAFRKNEEFILKSSSNIKNIQNYISKVKKKSNSIDTIENIDIKVKDLINFFKTGSIYFKPKKQISFTFSELNLPHNIERKLMEGDQPQPRHTNSGKPWGAYNLKLNLSLESEANEDKQRINFTPYAIETCYGYWVPESYINYIEDQINKKSIKKKKEFKNILNALEKKGVKNIVRGFKEYIEDIKKRLQEKNIEYDLNEEEIIFKFQKFVEKTKSNLSDNKKLEKLCKPYILTGMPEIWEDKPIYDAFEESFMDYVEYSLALQKIPKIIGVLKKNFSLNKADDSDGIKIKVNAYFESNTWRDGFWYKEDS